MYASWRGAGAGRIVLRQKNLGTGGGQAQRQPTHPAVQHPPSKTRPVCTCKPLTQSGVGRAHTLTCGFVALKVDDTHSLEARAALITSRIDQGEVSI